MFNSETLGEFPLSQKKRQEFSYHSVTVIKVDLRKKKKKKEYFASGFLFLVETCWFFFLTL